MRRHIGVTVVIFLLAAAPAAACPPAASILKEERPHDAAQGAGRAEGGSGGPGPQRDQRAWGDRRDADERRAPGSVHWGRSARATVLPPLAGHTWTNAWSIGENGVVSGWSRRLPNEDGENNPVIWMRSGAVTALGTVPGRADGAAESTNRAGLTVGYLGNLGTETDPENDFATA